MTEPLLEVRGLEVSYEGTAGSLMAVRGVDFDVRPGEVLGLVGESGSGKSTVAQAVMRTLGPPAVIRGGRARFQGRDIFEMSPAELQRLRWRDVSMVVQSALDSLNPVLSVRTQIAHTLSAHGVPAREFEDRSRALMELVGIDVGRLDAYPHQLSGGMRQRVVLGLALALSPSLIFMDEPTTALDVVVERRILRRVAELQRERGFAVVFITHDLSLLLEFADRVAVLYAGRVVESAPTDVLRRTGGTHPYTRGLLGAIPRVFGDGVPVSIPGAPPSLQSPPSGCRFHPRCARVSVGCDSSDPEPVSIGNDHLVACPVVAP